MTEQAGGSPLDDNPGGVEAARTRKPRNSKPRAVTPRHAASLVLWRRRRAGIEVLMGLRHRNLRFMPNVMVFPGGRVDREDYRARAASELRPEAQRMLRHKATPGLARALAVAAVRELWEEAGLTLGAAREGGVLPDLAAVDYLCRAVTPADRPIRFNARFLVAPADAAHGEIKGSGELEELRYFSLDEVHQHKVMLITARVLEEFTAWLAMSPAEREARQLVAFLRRDDRKPDL